MGTELPTTVLLGQTQVLMQMKFLNNARKVRQISYFQNFLLYIAIVCPVLRIHYRSYSLSCYEIIFLVYSLRR
jgi:hypothetical protein